MSITINNTVVKANTSAKKSTLEALPPKSHLSPEGKITKISRKNLFQENYATGTRYSFYV
jgi:flagella basal body P-ring formation protein FlgA